MKLLLAAFPGERDTLIVNLVRYKILANISVESLSFECEEMISIYGFLAYLKYGAAIHAVEPTKNYEYLNELTM